MASPRRPRSVTSRSTCTAARCWALPAWSARAAPNCCGCWPAPTAPSSGRVEIDGKAVKPVQSARRHRRRHRPGAGGAQARRHRAACGRSPAIWRWPRWACSRRAASSISAQARKRVAADKMQRVNLGRSCSTGRSGCSAAATSRRRSSAAGWRRGTQHPFVRRADARHRCRRQGGNLPSDRGARRRRPFRHRRVVRASRGHPALRPRPGHARRHGSPPNSTAPISANRRSWRTPSPVEDSRPARRQAIGPVHNGQDQQMTDVAEHTAARPRAEFLPGFPCAMPAR